MRIKTINHWIVLVLLLLIFIGFIFLRPYYLFIRNDLKISLIKTVFFDASLKTNSNQTNILLLGIPGGNYEGPFLSDSITVININFENHRINTISLPRDIWSETLRDKINSAYAYGEAKQKGGGIKLAKAEIEPIVNLPIHYAAVIDFDEFKKLIDLIGGIEVDIDKSFIDTEFPIEGRENDNCNGDLEYKCRYETVSFTKGAAHLNGEMALKFVRSRHGNNDEGSDFSRGIRQQKVIDAVKNSVLKIVKRLDLNQIKDIYENINYFLKRDIANQELSVLVKKVVFSEKINQNHITLPEDLFTVPDYSYYDNKYVLIPVDNSYERVHSYIKCRLQNENCADIKK